MKGKRPDYVVNSVVETDSGKSRWREIGVGFVNEKSETITVQLDAFPVGGKLVLTRPSARPTATAADEQ